MNIGGYIFMILFIAVAVGGKILYTKDIDEELFDRIAVGQTYKALIRDGAVKKIELC